MVVSLITFFCLLLVIKTLTKESILKNVVGYNCGNKHGVPFKILYKRRLPRIPVLGRQKWI